MRAGVEIVQHGADQGEWMLGFQVAIDGQLSQPFDLHKSAIREARSDADYEALLIDSAERMLRLFGPERRV